MGFKDVLKTMSPFISVAAGMGGPIGVLAASTLAKALGVEKVEPTQAGIEKAITEAQIKDPDALIKLQAAEQDFQLQMKKLGFESAEKMAALEVEDRASARSREIAVKDNTPRIIAYLVVAMTFIAEGMLLFHGVPKVDGVVLGRILGTLDSALIMVLSYFFGSTSGSAQKTNIIADQAAKAAEK